MGFLGALVSAATAAATLAAGLAAFSTIGPTAANSVPADVDGFLVTLGSAAAATVVGLGFGFASDDGAALDWPFAGATRAWASLVFGVVTGLACAALSAPLRRAAK